MLYAAFIALFFVVTGCENLSMIQQPDLLKTSGVVLGNTKLEVQDKMGKAKVQLNFRNKQHEFAIWEYETVHVDYQPNTTGGDDMGYLPPSKTIREFTSKDYRMVFVDGRLCIIEDFLRQKEQRIAPEDLPPSVSETLEEILKDQ